MAQDLSGLYISQSFQNLIQRSASGAFNVLATATGTEFIPVSASYAISSSHTSNADNAISSSYAISSSHAVNADIAIEAEDLIITVKNTSGGTLAKGTPVHAVSVTGENVDVIIASNDNASNMPAIGLLSEDISNNAAGPCIIAGRDTGLDTSGLIAGSSVYVGVNGVLTSVKPTGSALIQNIGTAAKINASDGEIIIQGAGRTNDLPNLQENYLWLGDANGVPQAVASSSLVSPTPNLQQVLTAGNTASLGFEVTGDARVNGKLIVSGSSNSIFDIDTFDLEITGGLDVSRDVAVRDDLTVYDDTNLRKDVNIGFRDDNPGFGYSLAVTQSTNTSGSAKFIGGITMESLPTTEPNVTGSLWVSGSGGGSASGSGYLMIFNP